MFKFFVVLCLFQILNKKPLMIPSFHFHLPKNYPSINNLVLIIFLLIFSSLQYFEAMRVHPMTTKRNVTIRDADHDFNPTQMEGNAQKKLKKLPHVFSKVLELPFRSDADVVVEEADGLFRFIVEMEVDDYDVSVGDVRAHAVEIHPGVIKIVVRNDRQGSRMSNVELSLNTLEVDTWRYRLPPSSLPEMATAMFVDGALIVTVPKGGGRREFVDGIDGWGSGNIVLVQ